MSKRNLTLLTDLYELTMMQGYFYEKDANETVIFDAFYRTNPDGNGFAIAAGLEQIIEYIENLHFEKRTSIICAPPVFLRKRFWNIFPLSASPVISTPSLKGLWYFRESPW